MNVVFITVLLIATDAERSFTVPKSAAAEYGHGLTQDLAKDGWISLFDGKTAFGWEGATASEGTLANGQTTTVFAAAELRADVVAGGEIVVGGRRFNVQPGPWTQQVTADGKTNISLSKGAVVRTLLLRPNRLEPIFNGSDLSGWKVLPSPKLSADRQTTWCVENHAICAQGGPGALEYERQYGDFVLQAEVRTKARLVNGGLFFRSIPHDFLNGDEAQIFNACYEEDANEPARYSTGAIDDRQLARRLVSRDLEPFFMTVLAVGPRISTWVNGHQMTDWTDGREPRENPREGLRIKPGAIQLQAHDADTDLEFRVIRIRSLE